MSPVETAARPAPGREARPGGVLPGLVLPALVAVVAAGAVLWWIVSQSESAWRLLAVGRELVPPEYYPLSGFVIVFATTLGQAAGWAGSSALLHYVATLAGVPRGPGLWKLSMSVAYVGLGGLPLLTYHVLFGAPLLGLPNPAPEAWLAARYPDAHWLLYRAHPVLDASVIPLAAVFLGGLWLTGTLPRRSRLLQTVLALTVAGASLAVALSLAVHSTLVHVRLVD